MTTPTPLTELDAVNIMLSVIGEAPVNSLEVSGLSDVAVAKSILMESSRAVQELGWHFNTEENYELAADGDGSVALPANLLRVDVSPGEGLDLVQRGNRLYDRENHTFNIGRNVKCTIVIGLPFQELPSAARYYITVKAARMFQKRILGSELIERFTQEDETRAFLALRDSDTDVADYNLLTGSFDVFMILER